MLCVSLSEGYYRYRLRHWQSFPPTRKRQEPHSPTKLNTSCLESSSFEYANANIACDFKPRCVTLTRTSYQQPTTLNCGYKELERGLGSEEGGGEKRGKWSRTIQERVLSLWEWEMWGDETRGDMGVIRRRPRNKKQGEERVRVRVGRTLCGTWC